MIKVKQYVKGLDQFSNQIGLHMNNSFYYKTTFGGLITILSYAFILLFFMSNINSFFEKSSVKVVKDSIYYPHPPRSNLSPQRFMFAVQIYQNNFLTNPYFNITVTQITQTYKKGTSTKNIEQQEIELEPCTPHHWNLINSYESFNELFKPYGYDFLCPSMDSQIFLEGMYGSDIFSYFEVKVTPCVTPNDPNRKWNPICASKEIVDQVTSQNGNQGINFYHSNFVLNVDQPEKFFTPFINDKLYFTFVPHKMARNCDIYIQDVSVVNDESIFFTNDYRYFKFPIQQDNDYREITELERQDDNFVVLTIRLSPQVTQINRSYQKFTELLSKLGGFTHLVMASLAVVIKKYNFFEFTVELANKLYHSDETNKMKTNKRQKSKNKEKKQQLQKESQIQNNINNNSNSLVNIQSSVYKDINNFSYLIQPQQIVDNPQNNSSFQHCLTKKVQPKDSENNSQTIQINQLKRNDSQKCFASSIHRVDSNKQNNLQLQSILKLQKNEITSVNQSEEKKQKKCFNFFNCMKSQEKKICEEQKQVNQISVFKYLVYYLFPRLKFFSKEGAFVTQAISLVSSDLDVLNIIKKTKQIDKLKSVIFDKHQKRLFDYSVNTINNQQGCLQVKQCIQSQEKLNQSKKQIQQISEEFTQKQDKSSNTILYDSYKQVKHQQLKNKQFQNVNQRLIDCLGENTIKAFQFKDACQALNKIQANISQQPSLYPTQALTQINLTPQNSQQKRSQIFQQGNQSFSQINLNPNNSQISQLKSNLIRKSIKSVSALTNNLEEISQDFSIIKQGEQKQDKKIIPDENTEAIQILSQLEKYQKDQILLNIKQKM